MGINLFRSIQVENIVDQKDSFLKFFFMGVFVVIYIVVLGVSFCVIFILVLSENLVVGR